jgi:baseplate J-like protein
MAILGTNLDYTDKDFDSLRARLFNLITGAFPTWTARQVANFGNILVELYCFVGDVGGKYQDNQAGDSRWSTATQRKNLIAMAKMIGFEPATATASQADLTISIPSAIVSDLTIDAQTVCRTKSISDSVKFPTLIDALIPAGATSVVVTGENSEAEEDFFSSPEVPNHKIELLSTPYIDSSLVLTAGNGLYSEVSSFLNSDSTDLHYTVAVDQNDKATVRFGDGVNGAIPTGTIAAAYKTGGGARGIVEAGSITVIEGSFQADDGTVVYPTVTNAAASTEATNRNTVEQIRQLAPLTIRVLNRTVAREDYEINALKVPGVVRALMLTSNEETAIGENAGILFIIPTGGGVPTTALKAAVLESVTVTYPNTLTFSVVVSDPLYKTINVYAEVTLQPGQSATTVRSRIENNLADFFAVQNDDGTANEEIDFGYSYVETTGATTGIFSCSDVHNVVRDTVGVKRVEPDPTGFTLNGSRDDVELLLREFPKLGTVTLINSATGTTL